MDLVLIGWVLINGFEPKFNGSKFYGLGLWIWFKGLMSLLFIETYL